MLKGDGVVARQANRGDGLAAGALARARGGCATTTHQHVRVQRLKGRMAPLLRKVLLRATVELAAAPVPGVIVHPGVRRECAETSAMCREIVGESNGGRHDKRADPLLWSPTSQETAPSIGPILCAKAETAC